MKIKPLWGIRFLGLLSLTVATVFVFFILSRFPARVPLWAGAGGAWALVGLSYLALSLTLDRSNRAFFGAFVGGILFRLLCFGLAVGYICWRRVWPVAPFALALAGGVMGLSLIELAFLEWQNRRWISSSHSNITSSTTSFSA